MDGFKADFVQYLRENNLLQRADLEKNDANINVQKYDDQLTDFLRDYRVNENELVEVAIDVNEILSMDFDNIANVVVDDNNATQGRDVVGGFFNFLINQNDIKAQVDKDGNGKFSDDEIAEFARTVASKDGDGTSFTLQDMMGSYQQMQNNEFRVGDFTAMNNNFFANNPAAQNPQAPEGQQPPQTPAAQYSFMETGSVAAITSDDLANTSKSELETEKSNQEGLLNNANANMNAALSGTSSEVQPSNAQVNSDYEAYLASIDTLEKDGQKYSTLISNQNAVVTNCQNELHTWQLTNEANKQTCITLDFELQAANDAVKVAGDRLRLLGEQISIQANSSTGSQGSAVQGDSSAQAASSTQGTGEGANSGSGGSNVSAELLSAFEAAKTELQQAKDEQIAKQEEYDNAVQEQEDSQLKVEEWQTALIEANQKLTDLQKEAAEAAGADSANVQNLANKWNQSRAQNEQARQTAFGKYSNMASTIVNNIGVINNAINDLPQEA